MIGILNSKEDEHMHSPDLYYFSLLDNLIISRHTFCTYLLFYI